MRLALKRSVISSSAAVMVNVPSTCLLLLYAVHLHQMHEEVELI